MERLFYKFTYFIGLLITYLSNILLRCLLSIQISTSQAPYSKPLNLLPIMTQYRDTLLLYTYFLFLSPRSFFLVLFYVFKIELNII